MPTSPDILITDEIVTAVNAQSFSMPFTAERVYAADWDGTELDDLQVGIWPGESNAEGFERQLLGKSYRVGLSFAKRLSAVPIATVDALCDLANEVLEFLELSTVQITGGKQYVNQSWEWALRFDDDKLDRNKGTDSTVKYTGLYASVLVFEFVSLE